MSTSTRVPIELYLHSRDRPDLGDRSQKEELHPVCRWTSAAERTLLSLPVFGIEFEMTEIAKLVR